MYNIPNMYIQLKELAQTSAEIPEIEERVGDLEDQVDGLDEQINGDSTAEPPVPGIVDELEAIETTLYGDTTTDPPVEGLTDRVDDLELTINGDSTAVPPVAGLTDRVDDLEDFHDGVVVAYVTADGVKTNTQLMDELFALISDLSTLNHTVFRIANPGNTSIMDLYSCYIAPGDSGNVRYGCVRDSGAGIALFSSRLMSSGSNFNRVDISNQAAVTYLSMDQETPTNGTTISIIKY